jgi:hypothetical protein
MSRLHSTLVIAVLTLLPTTLLAGGPPWLCLPIDGVTPQNAKACQELLAEKLKDKLHTAGWSREIRISDHKGQKYFSYYLGTDVGLADVEAALKGSAFRIPRGKLRLFGHAILHIDGGVEPSRKLLADLDEMGYVSIEGSESKDKLLVVKLDIPYPTDMFTVESRDKIGWDSFTRNDLNFDHAARATETPATPKTLPAFDAIRDIVAKHKATLSDVRWDPGYACRPLGCAAGPPANPVGQPIYDAKVGRPWEISRPTSGRSPMR